jgi:hypothetical protein
MTRRGSVSAVERSKSVGTEPTSGRGLSDDPLDRCMVNVEDGPCDEPGAWYEVWSDDPAHTRKAALCERHRRMIAPARVQPTEARPS